MEALGFNLEWFIFQLVNFGILLTVLNHFLHKPLLRLLDKRRQDILEVTKNTEETRRLLAQAEEQERSVLATAQLQAQEVLEVAHAQAKEAEERLRQEAENKAVHILAQAKSNIDVERTKMRTELQAELSSFVVSATQKILQQDVSEAVKHKSLHHDVEHLPT
jgi:F-type H+-transporting ATPase subunit b